MKTTDAVSSSDAYLLRNAAAVAQLNDSIFYFGELGMQEFETAALMSGLLEENGFAVERGISGFPTAFCATYGEGGPTIALHTEYDANPDNSQKPGIVERSEIVPGAPGHCEGHNCNGAVLVATALAVRHAMQEHGIPGRLKVFGAPAEEQVISRPYFVRDGWFDDVDIALAPHIGREFSVGYGLIQSALISAVFTFHGQSAHAGVEPWNGKDALDAVVLMDAGLAQYREHMYPGTRMQRVILNGGSQPNVVPKTASIWWYFRAPDAAGARRLFETAQRHADGAALMTDTKVEVSVKSAVWPVRGNAVLAKLVEENFIRVGNPDWSEAEHELARSIQVAAGTGPVGLSTSIKRMAGPAVQRPAANDAGDISWKVPHAKMYYPANIPGVGYHTWTAGVALATSIAHKGIIAGSRALAGAVLEALIQPDIVETAKTSFKEELGDVAYESMLPPQQAAPIELNADAMSRYRPEMRPHYREGKPVFR